MRSSTFESWAAGGGGLNSDSARSCVSYLATVEMDCCVDLDADWQSSSLFKTRAKLATDQDCEPEQQAQQIVSLDKI